MKNDGGNRALGNVKMLNVIREDIYGAPSQVQFLPTIRKGEFIPSNNKNAEVEFIARDIGNPVGFKFGPQYGEYLMRKTIPFDVYEEYLKDCSSDKEYIEMLNKLGYNITESSYNFNVKIVDIEEKEKNFVNDYGYVMIYDTGLNPSENTELLENFVEEYSDCIQLEDFFEVHLRDLLGALGGKKALLGFMKHFEPYFDFGAEGNEDIIYEKFDKYIEKMEKEIDEITEEKQNKSHSIEEIADAIEPKSSDMKAILDETLETEINEEAKKHDGQTQADE
jgi:hypothetical protein